MKLQAANDFDVQVVGSNTSSSFSIAMNGKAFRVLSSTLYQNKIGSIVREISCNAVDGHTMAAKKDVPFEIHLPDMFEPWFSVRDFGVGMDRATIQNVFTKYFESTKDQSNDAIGAFGLGAKTPFSYTDQFTVTSITNGEKVVYSAYILNDLPQIDEMHSEPTALPQGVEIKISVKKEDYSKFKDEVVKQLRYFKVKPKIVNGSVNWPVATPISSTDSFTLYKGEYGNRGIVILQGDVGYDLQHGNMKDIDGEISTFIQQINNNYKLVIDFPIGKIGVTASREGVEYDTKTVANIVDRLNLIRSIMGKEVNDKIAECTTNFQRNTVYWKMSSLEMSMIDTSKYPTWCKARWSNVENSISNSKIRTHYVQSCNQARKNLKFVTSSISIDSMYGDKYVIVLKDTSNRLQKRADKLRETHDFVYVISDMNGEMSVADCDAMKERIQKETSGFQNIIKASEVELPVAERKKYSRTGPITKFILLDTDNTLEKVTDSIDSIEGPFIYRLIDRLQTDKAYDARIAILREMQESNGEEVLPVVFVNEKGMEKIKKLTNEKYELDDYISDYKKQFDRASLKRKYISEKAKIDAVSGMDYAVRNFVSSLEDDILKKDADVAKVATLVKTYQGAMVDKNLKQIATLMDWHGTHSDVLSQINKVTELIRNKAMKTGSKNMVFKWYATDSYAMGRLPADEVKSMLALCATNKMRV